ncbi:MAG: glycosyltransferase family 9 protein [Gammaproteobacteria bacterium]|jgi:ADP-heptose:LPS heptosyltransferase
MQNILVIRNDKLGDFMLAWPAISLLKLQYPESKITALVPSYTKPIAECCPWIDNILVDKKTGAIELAGQIKTGRYDASVSLYSELRTSMALWLARVPVRSGPATKIAQIFLNRRLRQRRSLSLKPEYEYNIDLSRFLIEQNGDTPVNPATPPYLEFSPNETTTLKKKTIGEFGIKGNPKLVFIHPGSGGSAVNLSLEQFAQLADYIARKMTVYFVITAGPDELETATNLASRLHQHTRSVYHSLEGLVQFARFISICDLFISGSTGPLHIAGALNVPTAAFYPARRSATSLRWTTLNEAGKKISFSPETYNKSSRTLDIDIDGCADEITDFLRKTDDI